MNMNIAMNMNAPISSLCLLSNVQFFNNYSEIQVVITNYLFFNDPSTFSPPNSTPPQLLCCLGIYEDQATADSHTNYRELFSTVQLR